MDDRPRILHVIKGLGPGGAERLLVSLAAVGTGTHAEVAYLLREKQHLVPELEALGVATHLLGGAWGTADPRWPARLLRLARRGSFDIVHFHSPAVAATARPLLRWGARSPVLVSTEHNVWQSHRRATRVANGLTLPLQAATFAVSEEVVRSAWPSRRSGMEVFFHGVDVEALRPRMAEREHARAELGVGPDELLVVTVANLRAQKAYPVLFRAAQLALAKAPSLRFVAIGQGPLEADLRHQLDELGLGDRFRLLGYHPDPPAVLAGADLYAMASAQEGLPIALLEAMSMAIPPVATAVGGVPEVLVDGRHGLVVPPGDPEALASALLRLAADRELRRSLGTASAARAHDFDIARTAATLAARYEALTSRGRNRRRGRTN